MIEKLLKTKNSVVLLGTGVALGLVYLIQVWLHLPPV